MNRMLLRNGGVLFFARVAAVAAALCGSTALLAQTYTLVDIGALKGGNSIVKRINLGGQSVGQSGARYGEHTRAFVFNGGKISDLGTLSGGDYSAAADVNHRGAVVGESNTATVIRAFLWDIVHGMQDLGTLPGDTASRAFGVNDSDQVVGYSSGPHGVTAFVWKGGTMTSLGTLSGGDTSQANSINNAGSIVGFSTTSSGDKHAFLWSPGSGMQDLGALSGDSSSEANRISNSGLVVGSSTGSGRTRAFLWSASSGMQDIGSLGSESTNALDVNESGVVVGTSSASQGAHAFYWSSATGIKDLNTMIPSDSGVVLTSATGINNAGLIVALGLVTSDRSHPIEADDPHDHAAMVHAYLLTPH